MTVTLATKHPLAISTWDDAERAALLRVIDSGHLTMGTEVAAFERQFAAYIGTDYAVMVNSGSSANLLMVAAYTLRYGAGTVIVPAVSWATSFSPFQQYGWTLVFVDIDDSLNMDPEEVRTALVATPGALVLACHLLGNPCDMRALGTNLFLEDNCESLGAEYDGLNTGSFGLMGSHSFFYSHHISTMEGGMITTNDPIFYNMLLCLRSHGWTRHLAADNPLGATVGPFEFLYPGYNVRPMEIQGAIGLAQLAELPRLLDQRRENAARCPLPLPREVGCSSWFGFATPTTDRLQLTCETRPIVGGNFTRSASIRYYTHRIQGHLPNANAVHDGWCYIGNSGERIEWDAIL